MWRRTPTLLLTGLGTFIAFVLTVLLLWAATPTTAQGPITPTPALQGDDSQIYGLETVSINPLTALQGDDTEVYSSNGESVNTSPFSRLQGDDNEIYTGETLRNPLVILQGDDIEIFTSAVQAAAPLGDVSLDASAANESTVADPAELALVESLPAADLSALERFSDNAGENLADSSSTSWAQVDTSNTFLMVGGVFSLALFGLGVMFITKGNDRIY